MDDKLICILHGYLLEGSGSNLWTRAIIKSLCNDGKIVHLMCQENHPERYDFIAESFSYSADGVVKKLLSREVPYKGKCVMHKPELGDTLPVYVWDKYEEFSNVVPMIELPDDSIEDYLNRNVKVLKKIISSNEIKSIHANHAVLMSVVAHRVYTSTGTPFAIMPHGSAIEYAVKKDERFLKLATSAFSEAKKIFVVGDEMHKRVKSVFPSIPNLDKKMVKLNLGVDTQLFKPISPQMRQKNILTLCEKISNLQKGKKPEQRKQLLDSSLTTLQKDDLRELISSVSYDLKSPDADLESKLNQVDWEKEKIILFVGRLISKKGIHGIIAALPLILDKNPSTRLVIVGHGPLREVLEIFLWALENGQIELVKNIAKWGEFLEDAGQNSFQELESFFEQLEKSNQINSYFEKARKHIRQNKVIFTGYLTHNELRYLFPCCDVSVFPSVTIEAGPLVFLEALASGSFPLGTYFGGMAASIDSVATELPKNVSELMKISTAKEKMVFDIANNISDSLILGETYKKTLNNIAVQFYDWENVSRKLSIVLESI
jgi:glycosyltransferase involved in cell wall biosynthesis